jgi:hypothetical protein
VPPTALFTLGVWEIVILVAALAILLGLPMIVVSIYMWIRRIIRRGRRARRRGLPPGEADES